ncbi:MAG TPA: hypothetical protein VMG12_31860 [Polyangiaceae bacterium]|nr:hypothetical protein [Polyangiaceae bacterium]
MTRRFRADSIRPAGGWLALTSWTLVSVVVAQLLVYRVILGVPPHDPHSIDDSFWEGVLSGCCVLVAVSALCGRSDPWARVVISAAWASAIIDAYFILYDWLRAGWGGEVGHDVFFGESFYWSTCAFQWVLQSVCFSLGAAVARALRRAIRRRDATHGRV